MWKNCFRRFEIPGKKTVKMFIFHDKPKFLQTVQSEIKQSVDSLWCKYLLFYLFIWFISMKSEKCRTTRSLLFMHSFMISACLFFSCGDANEKVLDYLLSLKNCPECWRVSKRERKLIRARVPYSKWKMKDWEFLARCLRERTAMGEKKIGKNSSRNNKKLYEVGYEKTLVAWKMIAILSISTYFEFGLH